MSEIDNGPKHLTMANAAADAIRKKILDGSFAPGLQLRQNELAKEFDISRVPIREALVLLESEGLIKNVPHRGAIVADLSPSEMQEIYILRSLIEPFLFEHSAPLLSEQDLLRLKENVSDYRESIDNMDSGRWNDLNTEFHMMLYQHADYPRLLGMVHNLLKECERHTKFQLSNLVDDRVIAVSEHEGILALCEQGKFAEGVEFLRRHLDHPRVVLLELIAAQKAAAQGEYRENA